MRCPALSDPPQLLWDQDSNRDSRAYAYITEPPPQKHKRNVNNIQTELLLVKITVYERTDALLPLLNTVL